MEDLILRNSYYWFSYCCTCNCRHPDGVLCPEHRCSSWNINDVQTFPCRKEDKLNGSVTLIPINFAEDIIHIISL